MRRCLLLLLAWAAPVAGAQSPGQSSAPSPALDALLADANRRNRLPTTLVSYTATVETELSVIIQREQGNEAVGQMEQVASRLRWDRAGGYEQRVVGQRMLPGTSTVSLLSGQQTGWLQPLLYGNRLRVRAQERPAGADSGRTARRRRPASPRRTGARADGADTLPAVHPLADDRDRFYRFAGGDTVAVIRAGDRTIPVVSVRVTPRPDVKARVLLFSGELQLDAAAGALVRMRGHFVVLNDKVPLATRMAARTLGDAVAFIEYENAERDGRYWLPARQRVEVQVRSPLLGEGRVAVRIASRFLAMDVNDRTLDSATLAHADSLRAIARRPLRFAARDTLDRYAGWQLPLGAIGAGMQVDDLQDVAPEALRPTGPPRLSYDHWRATDLVRFNRVEGLFTGASARLALRDAAPGVVLRATAGYAWSERTVRGRLSVQKTTGPWILEARGGRSLDVTNDFRVPLDSMSSLGALLGSVDPLDYVDRWGTHLSALRTVGRRDLLVRAEVGVARDRWRPRQLDRGLLGSERFRENQWADPGRYVRSALLLEWKPDVAAEFARPGLGARLLLERGDGTLAWRRAELRLSGRKPAGPFLLLLRGDVGMVTGAGNGPIPTQQLFEMGRWQNLPGYGDKQFAGSQAAMLRSTVQWTSPWLRAPIRRGGVVLPGVNPGLSVGVQAGWTDTHNAAARAAVARLGATASVSSTPWPPVSVPSESIRGSMTAGLRFFSGIAFLGATAPLEGANAGRWRGIVTVGSPW
jgi:hypothetical protein